MRLSLDIQLRSAYLSTTIWTLDAISVFVVHADCDFMGPTTIDDTGKLRGLRFDCRYRRQCRALAGSPRDHALN